MSIAYLSLQDVLVLGPGFDRLVCMLKASWDESGKSSDNLPQTVCLAGCITFAGNWEKLKTDWQEVMSCYGKGVEIFHTSHFEAKTHEFSHFTDDDKNILRPALIKVINNHVPVLYAAVASTSAVVRPSLQNDPINDCIIACSEAAAIEASMISESAKVEMFFEDDKEYGVNTRRVYRELRSLPGIYTHLGPDDYPKKTELAQLQAADLLAWTARYEYRRYFLNPNEAPHPTLTELREDRTAQVSITPYLARFCLRSI